MKKILVAALLTFATTIAFANSTNITLTKKSASENPINYWSINNPNDVISFSNLANAPLNVQVSVNQPTCGPGGCSSLDPVTVTCNNKEYTLNPGSALVCPVSFNGSIFIQDKNFKDGSTGTYAVLQ